MYLPTATPPVKVTRSTSGLVSISSAISCGSPVTTENISRRQTRFVQDVGQQQRGERRLFGRLQHHAVVGRDRRRDLVRDLVQRMVERRDRRDHALQRLAQRVDLALLAVRRQVAGKDLAVVGQRRVAGEHEDVAGAADLVERILLADAALGGDQVGDLVGARADHLGGAMADPIALVARQPRLECRATENARRTSSTVALGTVPTSAPVYGLRDFDDALAADQLAGDAHFLVQHAAGPHARQVGDHVHRGIDTGKR